MAAVAPSDGDEFEALVMQGEAEKVKENLKRDEEVAALSLPEGLSEGERVDRLLESEHAVQQSAALCVLPQALRDCAHAPAEQEALLARVLGHLEAALEGAQVPAEKRAGILGQMGVVAESLRTWAAHLRLLQSVLLFVSKAVLRASYGPATAEELRELDATVRAIDDLLRRGLSLEGIDRAAAADEVLRLSVEAMGAMESSSMRAFGVRFLGVLLGCHNEIEGLGLQAQLTSRVVPLACALLGDVDTDVRAAACAQLGALAQALPPEEFIGSLLPEYFEVATDEEVPVQLAAVRVLDTLPAALPGTVLRERFMPWVVGSLLDNGAQERMRCATRGSPGDLVFAVNVGYVMGPLIHSLKDDAKEQMGDPESPLSKLLALYAKLCRSDLAEVRQVCAFNLPGVALTVGGMNYAKKLHESVEVLASDPAEGVRTRVAAGLHELAKVLGKQRMVRYVAPTILPALLADDSVGVRKALSKHLSETLHAFAVVDDTQREETYKALARPVLAFLFPGHKAAHRDWRWRKHCVEQVMQIEELFAPAEFDAHCVPALLDYMRGAEQPVREAAADALAWTMSHNPVTMQKVHIIHDIKAEFCRGASWHMRSLFVHFCSSVAVHHEPYFAVKYRLADAVLDLLEDKVANVRICVCAQLPHLVTGALMPLKRAEEALTAARGADSDAEVRLVARDAVARLPDSAPAGAAELAVAEAMRDQAPHRSLELFPLSSTAASSARMASTRARRVQAPRHAAGSAPHGPRARANQLRFSFSSSS